MNRDKNSYSYGYLLRDIVKCIPYSFTIIIICNLCLAAAPSIVFVLSAKMFDGALGILSNGAAYAKILPYILGYLGVYLVLDQISMFSNLATNKRLFEYCNTRYKILLSKKASKLEMQSLDNDITEDLKRRAITCIEQKTIPSLAQTMIELFFSIFSVASVVFVLSQYSMWFIPVAVFSVCPYFIIKKVQGEKYFAIRGHQIKSERIKEYLWTLFSDKQCMKELHTMGFGEYLLGKWKKVNSSVNEELWTYNIKEQEYNLICEVVRILGYFVSVGLTLVLSLRGMVSIGALGACIMAFQTVQEQMAEAFGRFGESSKLVLFLQNYCEFMNLEEEKEGTCSIRTINTIKVRDLNYKYPNADKNALEHIDLTINKGEKIALVGENGSGKTTFVKCLLGIYSGQEGSVLYNNDDVRIIKRSPEQIGVVEQNVVKYYFTVKDAVLMGDHYTYSKEEIASVFQEVGLEYLVDRADFMERQLGAEFGGIELSGGEWQRLAIARCILKKPELLILDEPTSALDPICENDLLLKMLSLVENSTSLIITHRVGICQNVDRIIVMKNGRIAEYGNHKELILKNGEYKRLYDMQRKWYI